MKKSKFTEAQIVYAIKQVETGTKVDQMESFPIHLITVRLKRVSVYRLLMLPTSSLSSLI